MAPRAANSNGNHATRRFPFNRERRERVPARDFQWIGALVAPRHRSCSTPSSANTLASAPLRCMHVK